MEMATDWGMIVTNGCIDGEGEKELTTVELDQLDQPPLHWVRTRTE